MSDDVSQYDCTIKRCSPERLLHKALSLLGSAVEKKARKVGQLRREMTVLRDIKCGTTRSIMVFQALYRESGEDIVDTFFIKRLFGAVLVVKE